MTDILPPAGWPNVRQLETNEFASGGANGNMNEQAKSLAARSELLKQYAALPYESKTGGYALNERVQLATGDIVRSTIASNVNNPNENMTGWEVPSLKPEKNLSDVPDKAAARSNLSVYSQAQVDNAIANATPTIPDATETTAGKAKIATTAIAKAGVNDTDFITAKKLADTRKSVWSNKTGMLFGTTYVNSSLFDRDLSVISHETSQGYVTIRCVFIDLITLVETTVFFGAHANYSNPTIASAVFTIPAKTSYKIDVVDTTSKATRTATVRDWSERDYA